MLILMLIWEKIVIVKVNAMLIPLLLLPFNFTSSRCFFQANADKPTPVAKMV